MSSGNPPDEGRETGPFPGVEIQDDDNLTDAERDALFSYDPFAERQEEDNIPSLAEIREQEAAEAAPAPEPEPAPAPTPAPVAPQMSERERLLHEQNELLRRQLANTEQALRSQPAQPREEVQPEDNLPPYVFQITDEYIDALRSENPEMNRRAIMGIVQGTARAVHQNLRTEYQEHVQTAVQNYVQRHTTSSRIENTVMQDYYGTYPSHNNPALQPVVVGVAQRIMRETGAQAWTPELRDRIGQGVNEILKQAMGQPSQGAPPGGGGQPAAAEPVQQQQSGAAARTTRPTGPAQTRPGSRPAPESPSETGAQIMDLFG